MWLLRIIKVLIFQVSVCQDYRYTHDEQYWLVLLTLGETALTLIERSAINPIEDCGEIVIKATIPLIFFALSAIATRLSENKYSFCF